MTTTTELLDPLREKLLGFLAAGVTQSSAALACGVSDGLVSQILEEPTFIQALADRSIQKLEAAIAHDESIESIEKKALATLEAKLPFVRTAMEAAKIFQTLNNAKRHAAPATNSRPESLGAQQVTLVLPKAAAVHIQMNAQNQVIEIAGRSMATLPSKALPALSEDRKILATQIKEKAKVADDSAAEALLAGIQNRPATMMNGVMRVL